MQPASTALVVEYLLKVNVKQKLNFSMCTSWRDEEVEVQLHSFLTSALDGYGCHTNTLVT